MSSSFPCNLREIEEVLKDYQDINELWNIRFDVPDINKSSIGELQKNRILGLFLWFKEKEKDFVTTADIKKDFEKFYNNKISRSNISTYLNQLTKDGVLQKEKKGKVVEYKFARDPPIIFNEEPFWLIYNFCIFPNYVCRMSFFANKLKLAKTRNKEEIQILELILFSSIVKRLEKCSICKHGD
ncbi:MAG: hypothetical protein ACTSX4_04005, partial [Candidatus Helarchaeota archaeon]